MSRSTLVVVLIAVAAAGAIGYSIGRDTAPLRIVVGEFEKAPELTPSTRREVLPPPPMTENPSLEQAIASIPVPERVADHGDGVITGRVLVDGSVPLADVRIVARCRWEGRSATPNEDLTLEEKVRNTVRSHRHDRRTRRETISGADGTFRLEGLFDGKYSLRAKHEGYSLWCRNNSIRPGESVEITGRAVATLLLTVLMPDGTPAPSVRITASRGGSSSSNTITPGRPEFTLQGGTWILTAATDGNTLVSAGHEITAKTGGPAIPITLRLEERPGIRGKVVFEDVGRPHSLNLLLFRGDAPTNAAPLKRTRVQGYEGWQFAFPDLASGTYAMRLEVGQRRMPPVAVTVGSGMVEQDVIVRPPAPAKVLYVRVIGPDGKDAGSARVSTSIRSKRGSRSGLGEAVRMPDGRFRVFHPTRDDPETSEAEDTRYSVSVRSTELGTRTVEYVPGRDRELVVEFEEPGRLRVSLTGYLGGPYEGKAVLALVPATDPGLRYGRTSGGPPDAKGQKTFPAVVPGSYVIALSVKTDRHRTRSVAQIPINLAAGEIDREVAFPVLYRLTVTVDERDARNHISLRPEGAERFGGNSVRPVDGKVEFDHLPAGTYMLTGGSSGGRITVRIPGTSVVRFAPPVPNAARVTVTDPEGFAARAGLRTGDVIVGVNGEEFERWNRLYGLLSSGLEIRLIVVRGSSRLEIPLDTKPLAKRVQKLGAKFESTVR